MRKLFRTCAVLALGCLAAALVAPEVRPVPAAETEVAGPLGNLIRARRAAREGKRILPLRPLARLRGNAC